MSLHKSLVLCCFLGIGCLATSLAVQQIIGAEALAQDDARAKQGGDANDTLPHKSAYARLGTVRFRHGDGILSLAYSPDGKILASGGRNEPVHLWDAETGKNLRQLNEHWVFALAFSADGKYLATGGANKTVRIWDVASGKPVRDLKGHKATVKALAFSKDGVALVSAGDDNIVRVWRMSDGGEEAAYRGHTFSVNAVSVSPDMKHMASGSSDRTVRIWNGDGKDHAVWNTPAGVTALVHLPDRKTLITGGDDGVIRVWDIAGGKQLREWKGHDNGVTHLLLTQDGKTVATTGLDSTVRIWNVADGKEIRKIDRPSGDADALALTRDGKQIAAGGLNNVVRLWDAANGDLLHAKTLPDGAVTALALSSDGKQAVAGLSTNKIHIFNSVTGVVEAKSGALSGGSGDVVVACGPDGKLALAMHPDSAAHGRINEASKPLALPKGDEIRCLAYSPDGKHLALAYATAGLRIWDIAAAKIHKEIPIPHGARAVAYSRDGKLLAVASEDAIVIHDAISFQAVRQYGKFGDPVACLAFAPDGHTLAAGMFNGTIRLFDLTLPRDKAEPEPRMLEGHRGVVNALAWSANGRCLISGGYDKTVRLWEFVNGQQIALWPGHFGEVTGVALHPSGRTAISASRDTTVLLWDVTGFGQSGKLPEPKVLAQPALETLWNELASDNNAKGNQAMWTLAATKDVAPYLAKKVFLTDPKKITQYLVDLNSNSFKQREVAFAALASYGRWIKGVLEDTQRNPPSEEVRQRVALLLEKLKGQDAVSLEQERLRARRVIEVLEQAATPQARDLLRGLAAGAAEENLREMAQTAADRVGKK